MVSSAERVAAKEWWQDFYTMRGLELHVEETCAGRAKNHVAARGGRAEWLSRRGHVGEHRAMMSFLGKQVCGDGGAFVSDTLQQCAEQYCARRSVFR
jgi:hypothetical protein